jgi:hypothetical protein
MNSVESDPVTSVTRLMIVTAAIEFGAGLTLLVAPNVIIRLVFGPAVDVLPAAGIARLAGAALVSLGAACWWARRDAAPRPLIHAMLIYNAVVVALVLGGALGALGPLQWAVVVLHGALAIWCVWARKTVFSPAA